MFIDKATPGASKILTRRWNEQSYETHIKKLNKIEPAVNPSAPLTGRVGNPKKE